MQWNNEAGLDAARPKFTGAVAAVQNHGDMIWEAMCVHECNGGTFTTQQIVQDCMIDCGVSQITAYQYVMAFFAYCQAAWIDFSGPASRLTRVRRGVWRMTDNPER